MSLLPEPPQITNQKSAKTKRTDDKKTKTPQQKKQKIETREVAFSSNDLMSKAREKHRRGICNVDPTILQGPYAQTADREVDESVSFSWPSISFGPTFRPPLSLSPKLRNFYRQTKLASLKEEITHALLILEFWKKWEVIVLLHHFYSPDLQNFLFLLLEIMENLHSLHYKF
jgi:hypothetical protein